MEVAVAAGPVVGLALAAAAVPTVGAVDCLVVVDYRLMAEELAVAVGIDDCFG